MTRFEAKVVATIIKTTKSTSIRYLRALLSNDRYVTLFNNAGLWKTLRTYGEIPDKGALILEDVQDWLEKNSEVSFSFENRLRPPVANGGPVFNEAVLLANPQEPNQ